jgi:hypothetical protein
MLVFQQILLDLVSVAISIISTPLKQWFQFCREFGRSNKVCASVCSSTCAQQHRHGIFFV